MRKLFTLFTIIAWILSCYASPLTPQQALQRVQKSTFAAKSIIGNPRDPQLVMTGKTEVGTAAYYVFSNSSGTLFISADDLVRPLLGYTDSGNFDPENMPPQLKWWLESYAKEINWATRDAAPELRVTKSPDLNDQQRQVVAPMLTTIWSQQFPFNMYCPVLDNERTVTGCVATSMAQVMNYHKWPQTTVAPISYSWNKEVLTSPSVTFDWDNMIDSYKGAYSTDQADAVARLMQVAGYSVSMQYNLSSKGGSGAYSTDIRSALVNDFGYDIGVDYALRDYFTAEEWEEMIYDNIVNVGPVIYDGRGTNGGHSFVCDGYDGDGRFHINWGWAGLSDGYFVLSALNPEALGTGGGDGGFNYNQGAVLGIQPPQPGSTPPVPYLVCSTELQGAAEDQYIRLEATDTGGFWNYGSVAGYFDFGASLENLFNGEVTYVAAYGYDLQPYYGLNWYWVELPESIQDGCYRVRPAYTVDGGEWRHIRFQENAVNSYIINITDQEITIIDSIEGEITAESWESPTGFASSEPYMGYLTVSSTYSFPYQLSLNAYLGVKEDDSITITEFLGNTTETIPANSNTKIEFSGVLGNLTPDTYSLVFIHDNSVIKIIDVEVEHGGEITCKGFNLIPETLTQGMTSEVEVIVESTHRADCTTELTLNMCTLEDEQLKTVYSYGVKPVTIKPDSEQSVSFSTIIPEDISEGTYYLVLTDPNDATLGYMTVELNPSPLSVDVIDTDRNDTQCKYYNLQGVEIPGSDLKPGVYIRNNGNEAVKILIR